MEKMILHLEEIDFDPDSEPEKCTIGGVIYFTIGDTYFPEAQWYDLISRDFSEWIPRLLSFAEGHTDSCEFAFMDGPYRILLKRLPSVRVLAVATSHRNAPVFEAEIDFAGFLASAAKCVRRLGKRIHEKDSQKKYPSEISRLGALSNRLETLAKAVPSCHDSITHNT